MHPYLHSDIQVGYTFITNIIIYIYYIIYLNGKYLRCNSHFSMYSFIGNTYAGLHEQSLNI